MGARSLTSLFRGNRCINGNSVYIRLPKSWYLRVLERTPPCFAPSQTRQSGQADRHSLSLSLGLCAHLTSFNSFEKRNGTNLILHWTNYKRKKKKNYYVISVCLGQAKGSICLNENYDKPQKKISKIYDLSCRVLICPLWSRQSQCHELRPENEYIKEIFPLENFFYVLL